MPTIYEVGDGIKTFYPLPAYSGTPTVKFNGVTTPAVSESEGVRVAVPAPKGVYVQVQYEPVRTLPQGQPIEYDLDGTPYVVGATGRKYSMKTTPEVMFMPNAKIGTGATWAPLQLDGNPPGAILAQFLIENRIPFKSPFKGVDIIGVNWATVASSADKVFLAPSASGAADFSTLQGAKRQVTQNGSELISIPGTSGSSPNRSLNLHHIQTIEDIESTGFDAQGRTFLYLQSWSLLDRTVAYNANAGDIAQANSDFQWGLSLLGQGSVTNPALPGTVSPNSTTNRILPFILKPRFTCPSIDIAEVGASVSQGSSSNTFINALFMATLMESDQTFAWGYSNWCTSGSSFDSSVARANALLDDERVRPKVLFHRIASSNTGFSEAHLNTAKAACIALQKKCLNMGVIYVPVTHSPWGQDAANNDRLKAHNAWARDYFRLQPNCYVADAWAVIRDPENDAIPLAGLSVGGGDNHWNRAGYNAYRDRVVIPLLRAIKAGIPYSAIPNLPQP